MGASFFFFSFFAAFFCKTTTKNLFFTFIPGFFHFFFFPHAHGKDYKKLPFLWRRKQTPYLFSPLFFKTTTTTTTTNLSFFQQKKTKNRFVEYFLYSKNLSLSSISLSQCSNPKNNKTKSIFFNSNKLPLYLKKISQKTNRLICLNRSFCFFYLPEEFFLKKKES